jgi:hypothetical protein
MKIVFDEGENQQGIMEALETLYYCWCNAYDPNSARRPKPSLTDYLKSRALLDKIQNAMEAAQ